MKTAIQLLGAFCLALMVSSAQTAPISSIRIYTVPDGARFYVDGQVYYASQTFLWPQGSKHIVQFPVVTVDGVATTYQNSLDGGVRYSFGGWQDNKSILASTALNQTITADPSITSLSATLSVAYRVQVRFSTSPSPILPDCAAPGNAPNDGLRSGVISFGGICYGGNGEVFIPAAAYPVNAFPYPGFVFTGWYVNGQLYQSYLSSILITGPTVINPIFVQGRRTQFVTDPPGMQVLVDRTPTPTSSVLLIDSGAFLPGSSATSCEAAALPSFAPPGLTPLCFGEFDFIPGSQHAIGAVTPQYDRSGKLWVFDSFSNGLKQNSVYTVPANPSSRDVITAKFVQGVQTAFLTNPTGLKLQIDGTTAWQSYNFVWASGSTHTVTAPATQVDNSGRRWTFQGWSNGGAATQDVKADPATSGTRLTATYAVQGQVKVTTTPPGIKLQVDGSECTSPCVVDRPAGTRINIAAPANLPQDAYSRLDFQGWNDSSSNVRDYTFSTNANTLSAVYAPAYKVTVGSDPENGVDLRFDPPSPDLYYTGDTNVSITAKAKPGFRFRRWGGDVGGTFPVTQLSVAGPRTVVAMLDRVPFITPAGIRSAAGPTADGTVAPGSIIAIVGESLAPRYEVGPKSPLAQAIADTVVTVNDRFLPLLFVSPNQINAQILSDLPDGDYTLRVQTTGLATVTGTFTISRNAPGLFTRSTDDRPISLAVHEDGSAISPDSPAKRGETVSLYGTGFGPYDQPVIDGFIIPDPSTYRLLDTVEVTVAGQSIQPVWTGAAPGYVGTTLTKLVIDDSFPSATNAEITVTVNNKASNKVLLPIE